VQQLAADNQDAFYTIPEWLYPVQPNKRFVILIYDLH
jgi:hypothetical protein